jgi:hypothetical protein
MLTAVQNGTSGVLAGGKHARRRAAWATPRTGGQWHFAGHLGVASSRVEAGIDDLGQS